MDSISSTRKKMRHLPGGDTGINKWPMRLRKLQEMKMCTQDEHDEIFNHDPPLESGDDQPGGASIDDLIDAKKVVAFPREHTSHLTRQMMDHEGGLGADVLIAVHPGSGESLKAILYEGGMRGIGIARNAAHKRFIMDNLREDIRVNKRAKINYPPKPPALLEWEKKVAGFSGARAGPPAGSAQAAALAKAPAVAAQAQMPPNVMPASATVTPAAPAAPAAPGGAFGNSRLL